MPNHLTPACQSHAERFSGGRQKTPDQKAKHGFPLAGSCIDQCFSQPYVQTKNERQRCFIDVA
jgi:hypothetical protein